MLHIIRLGMTDVIVKTLLATLFFLFFSSLIRVPAYAVGHSEGISVHSLLNNSNYEVVHVDRDSDNYLTLIISSKRAGFPAYICKIWDNGLPPQNAGCFDIGRLEGRWD